MNKSEAIRAYVAANPGATVATIRAALGFDAQMVSNACKKMAKWGLLVSTPIAGVYNRCTYTIGREVLIDRTERARMVNRVKAEQRRTQAQQPSVGKAMMRRVMTDLVRQDTQVAYSATPDTDEWLAAGGHVQVIPAKWQAPTRYPMYAGGFV